MTDASRGFELVWAGPMEPVETVEDVEEELVANTLISSAPLLTLLTPLPLVLPQPISKSPKAKLLLSSMRHSIYSLAVLRV